MLEKNNRIYQIIVEKTNQKTQKDLPFQRLDFDQTTILLSFIEFLSFLFNLRIEK
jgi:hypothetical protein